MLFLWIFATKLDGRSPPNYWKNRENQIPMTFRYLLNALGPRRRAAARWPDMSNLMNNF